MTSSSFHYILPLCNHTAIQCNGIHAHAAIYIHAQLLMSYDVMRTYPYRVPPWRVLYCIITAVSLLLVSSAPSSSLSSPCWWMDGWDGGWMDGWMV